MYYAVTFAILLAGIWMLVKASSTRKALARYEFENRTDGGVVKFRNFEDSERHRVRSERVGNLVGFGMLLTLVGGLAFLGGVLVAVWQP